MSSLFYYLLPSAAEQRIRPYRNGGSVTVRTDTLLKMAHILITKPIYKAIVLGNS